MKRWSGNINKVIFSKNFAQGFVGRADIECNKVVTNAEKLKASFVQLAQKKEPPVGKAVFSLFKKRDVCKKKTPFVMSAMMSGYIYKRYQRAESEVLYLHRDSGQSAQTKGVTMAKSTKNRHSENDVQKNVDQDDVKNEYCNVASIIHTENEFVLDFFFQVGNRSQVVARIITNPRHAKAVLKALEENVEKYESQFGEIKYPRNINHIPSIRSEMTH